MFNLFLKKKPINPFLEQARKDQLTALYPGCELGSMRCGSQSCGCNERKPNKKFVEARVEHLRLKSLGQSSRIVD